MVIDQETTVRSSAMPHLDTPSIGPILYPTIMSTSDESTEATVSPVSTSSNSSIGTAVGTIVRAVMMKHPRELMRIALRSAAISSSLSSPLERILLHASRSSSGSRRSKGVPEKLSTRRSTLCSSVRSSSPRMARTSLRWSKTSSR